MMANLAGKTLGKYEILELLGKGGMAEVYKAYHPKLQRHVTIKVLHSFLAEGEDFRARFEREARAVAGLRHQHIVQIHDFEVEGDIYYMVMEFVDGGTLQASMEALAQRGAYMPLDRVLAILRQVAEALDYAHSHNIIHRDVKPSNILLDSAGNAFLADFGIARMMSMTQFTSTGALIGTPTYMSPEQGQGVELTTSSDIYSLGVILFELLTGKVPFTSETTPLAIIHKHINELPCNPGALRPNLPVAVDQVVLKALAKEPAERYQSAREFAQALEKALPQEVITRLDASGVPEAASISRLPTIVEEQAPDGDWAHLPTAVMGKETQAAILGETIPIGKPTPEISAPEAAVKSQMRAAPVEAAPPKTRERSAALSWLGRLRSRPVVYILIGAAIVGVLILVASSLLGKTACPTVDDCMRLANPLRGRGDLEGYLRYSEAALARVPADQHPPYAGLWCDHGDVERQLGQTSEAIHSYTTCADWTQGGPALQPLRDRAAMALGELR